VPVCLEEWTPRLGFSLLHRDTADGHLVGVGDALTFTQPRALSDLSDGWRVGRNSKDFDPAGVTRLISWADCAHVRDVHGRQWLCPIIQTPDGSRAFRTAYGPSWLPALTPEQTRAEEIAAAARSAFASGAPMSVACQWAAELLCLTHHLTPDVIASLNLLDDVLVVGVLQTACSRELEKGAAANGL
jgi:hypothetical protein